MATVQVELLVPLERKDCACWVLKQTDPGVIADALQLCEVAYYGVKSSVQNEEVGKRLAIRDEEIGEVRKELQEERKNTHTVTKRLQQSHDEAAHAERTRHDAMLQGLNGEILRLGRQIREQKESDASAAQSEAQALKDSYEIRIARVCSNASQMQQKLEAQFEDNVQVAQQQKENAIQIREAEYEKLKDKLALQRTNHVSEMDTTVSGLRHQLTHEFGQAEKSFRVESERKLELLQSEIQSLTIDVGNRRGSEAVVREETRAHYSEIVVAHENTMKDLRTQLHQFQDEHHREMLQKDERQRQDLEWYRQELSRRQIELVEATKKKDTLSADFTTRIEAMAASNSELMGSLSGTSTAKGRVGEKFVQTVLAGLCLGVYRDDSHTQAQGYADGLWEWQSQTAAPKLSCIVEIKNVAGTLHSMKDIKKWEDDLSTAVSSGRANAGMFFSLAACYPNTQPIHLCMMCGVPVCIASRAENDAIPARSLVELSFRAFAEIFPLLCKQRGEGAEATMQAAVEHIQSIYHDLAKFSKHITTLNRLGNSILKEANGVGTLRDEMVRSIDCLRQRHPVLVYEQTTFQDLNDEQHAAQEDPWASAGALALLDAVATYLDAQTSQKRRYPKTMEQLSNSEEGLGAEAFDFCQTMPNALVVACQRVRQRSARKRARIAGEVSAADIAGEVSAADIAAVL
jgi:hypothetical protein